MARADALVERALQQWPVTRDNDRKLIMAVWWLQNNNYEKEFKSFFQHTAIMPETITRCRRKLQEQGKYRASESVEQQRYEKFKRMKYETDTPDDIGRVLDA